MLEIPRILDSTYNTTLVTMRIIRYLFIAAIISIGDPNLLQVLISLVQSWT